MTTSNVATLKEQKYSDNYNDVTFGFGDIHKDLFAWAKEGEVTDIVYSCCHALGLSPTINGFGNLFKELNDSYAIEILSKLTDEPIAYELKRLAEYYRVNHECIKYYPLEEKDFKRIPKNQKQSTLLLRLLSIPISITEPNKKYCFKVMRIWLLIHTIKRLSMRNTNVDKNIATVINYLRINANVLLQVIVNEVMEKSLYQSGSWIEWGVWRIDKSIMSAANYIKENYHNKKNIKRNDMILLNSLTAISLGKMEPVEDFIRNIEINISLISAVSNSLSNEFINEDLPSLEILSSNTEDEQDEFYLVDTTEAKSFAEQEVISRSVFLQRAVAAHYLPWEWNKPIPTERVKLNDWIDKCLRSESTVKRLGGSIVWISLNIGRSLHFASMLRITDETHDEWSISSTYTKLHRVVPKRHGAWKPSSKNLQIQPFEDTFELSVPQAIVNVMSEAALKYQTNQYENLKQLWKSHTELEIVEWFNNIIQLDIKRLTSGKLAEHFGQTVFEETSDHRLARLIESHPNTGLSAACGYGSWSVEEVGRAINAKLDYSAPKNILLGSRLNPLEEPIVKAIQAANKKLEKLAKTNIIDFHNGYSQYCVNALYAGTGGRPLDHPFESFLHFNFNHKFVYINDKSDAYLHDGRLVPLPSNLVLLINDYLSHLDILAAKLSIIDSELSDKIVGAKQGVSSDIPLFFQITDDLNWTEIKQELPRVGRILDWELPGNFFRHRYSQQLTRLMVNPEVIDAWMGHGERGATTYSENSMKCILDDFKMYEKEVDIIYDSLKFKNFECIQEINLDYINLNYNKHVGKDKLFGLRLRKLNLRKRREEIKTRAEEAIDSFLDNKKINELTTEEIEKLTSIMLSSSKGLPHKERIIRYETLIKRIEDEGSLHHNLIKKRIVKYPKPRSVLSEETPSYFEIFKLIKNWKTGFIKQVDKSKLSKQECLFYSVIILIVEKRLTYTRMLLDIYNGKNFRLVKYDENYYLEYSEDLDANDWDAPVQRHLISSKTCSMLSNGKTKIINKDTAANEVKVRFISQELMDLIGVERNTPENIISRFVAVMMHANELELPGIASSALNGKTIPTSLSWYDKVRIEKNKAVNLTDLEVSDNNKKTDIKLLSKKACEADITQLQKNGDLFYKEIGNKIDLYQKSNINTFIKEVEGLIKIYNGKVSRTVSLLPEWLMHITKYGTSSIHNRKRTKKDVLARNTIKTYFSTLSVPIKGLAYDIDIFTLDKDGLTELYENMLLYNQEKNNQMAKLANFVEIEI